MRTINRLEIQQELEARESRIAAHREEATAKAEVSTLTAAIPELADPDSPLTLVYDRLVDKATDADFGPGAAMKFAKAAWAKVYPGKPFPANGTAARQAASIVQPPQNGRPVAALATNGGVRRTATDILQNPDNYSKEDLLAVAAAL